MAHSDGMTGFANSIVNSISENHLALMDLAREGYEARARELCKARGIRVSEFLNSVTRIDEFCHKHKLDRDSFLKHLMPHMMAE